MNNKFFQIFCFDILNIIKEFTDINNLLDTTKLLLDVKKKLYVYKFGPLRYLEMFVDKNLKEKFSSKIYFPHRQIVIYHNIFKIKNKNNQDIYIFSYKQNCFGYFNFNNIWKKIKYCRYCNYCQPKDTSAKLCKEGFFIDDKYNYLLNFFSLKSFICLKCSNTQEKIFSIIFKRY